MNLCEKCNKTIVKGNSCNRCEEVIYCSKKCKRANWKKHRKVCKRECILCFDKYSLNEAKKLTCGHSFHKQCIDVWLQEHNTCPYCRQINDENRLDFDIDEAVNTNEETFMVQVRAVNYNIIPYSYDYGGLTGLLSFAA